MNHFKNKLRRILNVFRCRWSRFWSIVDRPLASVCSHSRLTTLFYYTFFNFQFHREQQAVLVGRRNYLSDLRRPQESSALLRRNTHRLEKGLLMRPRRDVFALGYLEETVSCYGEMINVLEGQSCSSETSVIALTEMKWAHDVLDEFFQVTASHPLIDRLRESFYEFPDFQISQDGERYIPYCRAVESAPQISYDAMYNLAKYRRSVRWYQDKPVPRDLIDEAIEVAAMSPSACNRQPFYFQIIDDPKLLKQVVQLPMGTAGYADSIPMMIVIVGQMKNYPYERDRHLIYIDASLAAMALVYALEVQGLSTCCINWPGIEAREKKMAKLLHLGKDERPIMCLATGYADPEGMVAFSAKKPLSLIRRFNFE